ncbi:type I restriction-modification enzyme R subunit C-terminal domain-containing protein [Geopsychrobacter electrodiphilus]|uniref:type I restriction endonuclease subunit R n=1 Tax=Geopsychrobacter electrodiphilus TaxID=225196 RepID=UPI0003786E39|nr:type I restriction-modification enzyme R subunit C-terminal domain-containing protein [Geopsychrobacter electrodiphilus]
MTPAPEAEARQKIDALLVAAGWLVQDAAAAHIHAGRGIAIREFSLPGHGFADYLLYVDGKAAGVIEAKKVGSTLTGVEVQSTKYTQGLPAGLPRWHNPLPFCYESTGVETRFTNGLDPEPRSRNVFAFHRPEMLADLLDIAGTTGLPSDLGGASIAAEFQPQTFLARLQHMPELVTEGLWPAQIKAIQNLEFSLKENRPRALIQMATGSGKTFTSINFIYRLIKFAGARRVLFLVDRGNLGRQTLKEFQQFVSPYNNFKFSEEYIVQHMTSNVLDTTARVTICTIQRLFSMLKGRELPEELDEESMSELGSLFKEPEPIEYNPDFPIGSFDIIVTDECHRSIYNLWRQVLEYFDAYLIGLTATPSKQTFGFFNKNLVMEYGHPHAVADGVNVNYDVYRIKTSITEQGSAVEAGYYVDKRDRETREVRWEQLDDDVSYEAKQLDRDVVSVDQIRTVIQTFRDKLFTEIFPNRTEVPKTLIFAKDDSHAEDIVKIVREEFGKGNDFAQKITYRTTGAKPEDLISAFRNSYFPRIVVTVDMIATGTDIKACECVFFMRSVKSRAYFEQMKGRGVRIINDNDLQAVTPDAVTKDHFVIVDAVGVCEMDQTDSLPMERKKNVGFEKLLQAVAFGNAEPDVISSVAARLARMEKKLTTDEQAEVANLLDGKTLKELTGDLVEALDPDNHLVRAQKLFSVTEPDTKQMRQAAAQVIGEAVKPLCNPELRELLLAIKKKNEQIIDTVSTDTLIFSGFTEEKARGVVESFEQFIADNKDEITALQVLYSKPYKQRLRFEDVRELAEKLVAQVEQLQIYQTHPQGWEKRVPDELWAAYQKLQAGKVRGASANHILTDLVSLVRFAMHQDNELVPFPEKVQVNFRTWVEQQQTSGKSFTSEQRKWLEMIRDHIAANLQIETDDFDYAPFAQAGGIGKVWQLFGDGLNVILDELNEALAA